MIVKICGITNVDDARQALEAGADWIGLNLVGGPRGLELATVGEILERLDDPSVAVVLVVVENGRVPEQITSALRERGACRLQLYGTVTPEAVKAVGSAGFHSIYVRTVVDGSSLEDLDTFLDACVDVRPDHVLFDAHSNAHSGGTGRIADWDVIADARSSGRFRRFPSILLAGGLTAENVADAIHRLRPAGVDVSSGIESAPGKKDHAKVAAFVHAARGA